MKTRIVEYTDTRGINIFRPQRRVFGIWFSYRSVMYWPLYQEYYHLDGAQDYLKHKTNPKVKIHEM